MRIRNLSITIAVIMVFALAAVAFAQTATPAAGLQAGAPSVTVQDQAVADGTVQVQQVVAEQDGWIVIHADDNGAPGAVVGSAPVNAGTNENVIVPIDAAQATPTLYAMLHLDAGTTGTFEFPGADTPVQVNGQTVVESFTVTGLQAGAGASPTPTEAAGAAAQQAGTETPTATATTAAAVATATPAATATGAAAGVTATRTAAPATLPTTGGSSSTLVVLLLGLGGLSLLAGLGLNLVRRTR